MMEEQVLVMKLWLGLELGPISVSLCWCLARKASNSRPLTGFLFLIFVTLSPLILNQIFQLCLYGVKILLK